MPHRCAVRFCPVGTLFSPAWHDKRHCQGVRSRRTAFIEQAMKCSKHANHPVNQDVFRHKAARNVPRQGKSALNSANRFRNRGRRSTVGLATAGTNPSSGECLFGRPYNLGCGVSRSPWFRATTSGPGRPARSRSVGHLTPRNAAQPNRPSGCGSRRRQRPQSPFPRPTHKSYRNHPDYRSRRTGSYRGQSKPDASCGQGWENSDEGPDARHTRSPQPGHWRRQRRGNRLPCTRA
jgi:hypothetical protein